MATIMDPRFKNIFFSSAAIHQNAKMLLDECMRVRENEPCYNTAERLSKRLVNDGTTSKLWGCFSEISSEPTTVSSKDQEMNSISCKVESILLNRCLILK